MGGFWSYVGHGIEDYAKARAQRSPMGQAIMGGVNRYRQTHTTNPTDPSSMNPSEQNDPNTTADPFHPGGMDVTPTPGMDYGDQSWGTQSSGDSDKSESSGAGAGLISTLAGLSQGKLVTSPTYALIGEKGPEAVVPMNANPNNKVSPQLLDQPGNLSASGALGQSGIRTRYRHVRGAQALGHQKPITSDMPLRPNNAPR